MDWNIKIPSCDFKKFDQGTIPNIDSVSGSSSYNISRQQPRIKGNFSMDLKLGQVIDLRNEFRDSLNLKGFAQTTIFLEDSQQPIEVTGSKRSDTQHLHASCNFERVVITLEDPISHSFQEVVSQLAKIPVLDTGKFEQWQFQIQQYLQHEHYALWEVIEFGDSYVVPANTTDTTCGDKSGRTLTLTAEDMQRKKNDVKARTTLLISLPDEHQL
uniref:Squamosa promoter-binding-like protein 13A n=1 Tax=Tanacetum cinerariifolium TaxID=118510 RepID=A0A6L2LBB4_TANCI|nr:squamosa promoter-binding-like protein 13A [Tanacetum cinerariifolium]